MTEQIKGLNAKIGRIQRDIKADDDTQPLQWDKEGNKHFLRYLKKMEVCDQETNTTETFKF
ncbi:3782_t:CDS:2 [Funneliformis geosporum]|uniref:3782_t:CDS:1 n=1 Tax=Funneliformis geosporum TaxID=1117311 RepID=A0A9W4WYI7_9GLOM|nr:3782_t:CDS:2 [Funneliformis geosporum]